MLYNVCCVNCGAVFQPREKSPLWWKAKQRDKKYLDALPISGEECGCIKKLVEPSAPFRVFGYDFECHDYDMPFHNFMQAVKAYISANRSGDVVWIKGVSDSVKEKLAWMI